MEAAYAQASRSTRGASHSCRPLILIVEDVTELRTLFCLGLRRAGFEILAATNGSEALDHYREHRYTIAAVLLDVKMPGWDGPQTYRALQALDPDIRCCFMSGNPDDALRDHLKARQIPFLWKPFHLKDLVDTLHQLVTTSGQCH